MEKKIVTTQTLHYLFYAFKSIIIIHLL